MTRAAAPARAAAPVRAASIARLASLALAALVAVGCGAGADPHAAAVHDLEAATRAFDRAVGIQTAFVGGGNVDVGATPEIIATALWGRVNTEAAGCVTATHDGNTVHADFGAGCALATAMMHAGGTVDIAVAPDPTGGVTAALTLAATVDGQALAGELDVSTPNGSAFSYAGTLTLDGTTATAPLVQAGIAGGGATLDAMNATVGAGALVLTTVHERFAGCYPDDGDAALGDVTLAFANDTPETGVATLTTPTSKPSDESLPKRDKCPPP